jgi:hypothetical protein
MILKRKWNCKKLNLKKNIYLREVEKATLVDKQRKIFNSWQSTLNRASIHEIISETSNSVTIRILPLTTSPKILKCGFSNFEKLPMYKSVLDNEPSIYITRILFDVTMTHEQYNK